MITWQALHQSRKTIDLKTIDSKTIQNPILNPIEVIIYKL